MQIRDSAPRLIALLGCIFCCLGAAEFPAFRMEEFEKSAAEQVKEFEKPEQIEVKPVTDREYTVDEQTRRLPVDGIVIEGVVPYPEYGITQESIQEIIDNALRSERAILLDENGFSEQELDDIGRELREILDRGAASADIDDMRALVEVARKSAFQRGWITIEQLDAIALKVTEYYREQGFILATAFIPAQEVTDNIIRFNVLEGRLGDVTVSNNVVFSDETVSAAVLGEIGEPVTEERIESALRRINDLPGLRVRGSFSPGEKVGETRLDLGVLDEQAWVSSLVFDNHGSESTGEHRLFGSAQWLNVANRGHRLSLGALRSEGPDSSTYGLIDYELPVTADARGTTRIGVSTNNFTVTGLITVPNILGVTTNYGVTGKYQFARSRTFNLGVEAAYTYKDVLFEVEDAPQLSRDEQIEVGTFVVNYNQLWDTQQLLMSGRFGVDLGHIINGALRDQSTDFTKILFSANILKRFSIGNWVTKNESSFNFVVKLNGQYSEKFLSSVEQFSLGGPNGVRAFSVSDVSVDSGVYAGFEMFFDSPLDVVGKFDLPIDPLRPFVFFDYAYGVGRTINGNDNRDAILKAYGLGVRLNWPGKATANLIFALPISAIYDDSVTSRPEGESRIFFDLRYQLR